ncbi:family 47 glycoside hydrolase [Melampsora larici-populina 98AG31]|uniref:alpha-1,2-Mannosidase n=1 Tax=Melampsora larici-populina (strain 98AG31 / pathotype 3-4-7) TaxID=747676 RepID=F4S6B6_MELLP|nr:family 47 glycoside hydrolase [Melampsora larici-populina 98AG31]EGF99783.1 family 47 glycoside hydrolase [Melampsora larici-populina 98AG31]
MIPTSNTPGDTMKVCDQHYLKTLSCAHQWLSVIPITRSYRDPRNGWGATLVDSMSTLYVMGLNVKGQATSVFETTIRYIGGILSVYELTGASQPGLLEKATEIAQKLETAWMGNSSIPFAWMYFDTNQHNQQETITIAEAGSLTIEFDRLSYWTKNSSHRILADKTSRHIMNTITRFADNTHVFPGLHPQTLDSATGTPRGDKVGWGANVDSFLEYGVKYWQLIGDDAVDYISYWQQAVDSSITHLLKWSHKDAHPYLVEYSANEGGISNFMTHLACFARLKLAGTCYDSYNSTKTGLGPDSFSYHENLYAINPEFILRPEVVESIWYAWRLTGDSIWQERAWEIFLALEAHCKTDAGYHGLYNVNNPQGGFKDETESFLFADLKNDHLQITVPILDVYAARPFFIG